MNFIVTCLMLIPQGLALSAILLIGGAVLYYTSAKRLGGDVNKEKMARVRRYAGIVLFASIALATVGMTVAPLFSYFSR